MPDVSPSGHGSGALSFMPVRGSCVPCSGALSPQAVLSVVSDQVSAACAEWLEESTEGEPSDACGLLRLCRRSGTPQGIPAAAGRPQGSDFFRAWRACGAQERR